MNKEQFQSILRLLPHKKQVEFAFYCAKDVQCSIKIEKDKKLSTKCLDLVEKWLKDDTSVTLEELIATAANTNTYAAIGDNYAFNNTVNAAIAAYYALCAANVVVNPVYSVNPAYYAVHAAYYAINAANTIADLCIATSKNNQYKAFNKYYQKLLEIADFDDLEKLLYSIEENI